MFVKVEEAVRDTLYAISVVDPSRYLTDSDPAEILHTSSEKWKNILFCFSFSIKHRKKAKIWRFLGAR